MCSKPWPAPRALRDRVGRVGRRDPAEESDHALTRSGRSAGGGHLDLVAEVEALIQLVHRRCELGAQRGDPQRRRLEPLAPLGSSPRSVAPILTSILASNRR